MSYTPINWQTGDTITAEKLNKMDNGWGVQSTQLFNETVTTVDHGGFNSVLLSYASLITEETIIVTLDGTEYVCTNVMGAFGAPYDEETGTLDFSTYPFNIRSSSIEGVINNLLTTQSAGEHTVSVSVSSVEISPNFETASIAATASAIDVALPYMVEVDETTLWDIYSAIRSGRLPIIVFKSAQSSAPAYIELVIYARPYNRTVRSIKIADDGSITVNNYTADSADGPIYPAS